MKQVSFEGIGQVLATFQAGEGVVEGHTVRVSGNGIVEPCTDGGSVDGVAVVVKNGCAAVQVRGFATVKATGVTAGRVKLSADASGGMKTDEEGGTPYLVAEADTTAGTIAVLL